MLAILALLVLAADAPQFVARTVAGKSLTGPLLALSTKEGALVGKPDAGRLAGADLLLLEQVGARAEFPDEDHLLLVSGARVPFRRLRLDEDRLMVRHADLGRGEVAVPMDQVNVIWRAAPSRALRADVACRRFQTTERSSDTVLLRNGDSITGTLMDVGTNVEIEVGGTMRSLPWDQVSAVGLNSALLSKPTKEAEQWEVVVAASSAGPGGWFVVTRPELKDETFQAKTTFGVLLSVPLRRVVRLRPQNERTVPLARLKPTKYEYFPYLDEQLSWIRDAAVGGGHLRVGGSTHARGLSMRAHSRLTFGVKGHQRFSALVGLDDREGKHGRVKCVVRVDEVVKVEQEVLWSKGPVRVEVALGDARTMSIEIQHAGRGPVRAVVNLVDAWLVKSAPK